MGFSLLLACSSLKGKTNQLHFISTKKKIKKKIKEFNKTSPQSGFTETRTWLQIRNETKPGDVAEENLSETTRGRNLEMFEGLKARDNQIKKKKKDWMIEKRLKSEINLMERRISSVCGCMNRSLIYLIIIAEQHVIQHNRGRYFNIHHVPLDVIKAPGSVLFFKRIT